MRNFREPTARNLLREPLIFGVPFVVLVGITLLTLVGLTLFGDSAVGPLGVFIIAAIIYAAARIIQAFAKPGWAETLTFAAERRSLVKLITNQSMPLPSNQELVLAAVDTVENEELISLKLPLQETLSLLREGQRATFEIVKSEDGYRGTRYFTSTPKEKVSLGLGLYPLLREKKYIYSLYCLPTVTTPLWLYEQVSKIEGNFFVISVFEGANPHRIKEQIETARRRNARFNRLTKVDSDVAFNEATKVLEGLARGDDVVLKASVVILSDQDLNLDPRYFCLEKNHELATFAVTGVRTRLHRSHTVRAATASDLILNLGDPQEKGSTAILKTPRGLPLYFDPRDSRLESLHWLVVGASGTGKSFFVGLVLRRLIQTENPISVLFIDHNRSFRRVTKKTAAGEYIEPKTFDDLSTHLKSTIESLGKVGTMAGIELSDLALDEKRAAIRILLSDVERWLRSRDSIHPVYLILDECWNFMREEPLLVQKAFREFRKLNGAAIAITQSLSDFLMDESGRAIFQNAPIRILLRQAEDIEPYRGVLGLNDIEIKKLRTLRQNKGEFSECLVKTPFLSRIGRLYPTRQEHELLRSDNIREELVLESLRKRHASTPARETKC